MQENLIYLIPLLPLCGAVFNLFLGRIVWRLAFGRDPSRTMVHAVAISSVVAAFGVSVWLIAGPLWQQFSQWKPGMPMEGLTQSVYTWIDVGALEIELAFRLDTLSALMIVIITFVGSLIHIYSTGYMADEPRYGAYFGYLNLFMGAMLILVLADNLVVMFIGWEGVGLCSYLLIGFWFSEEANATAGRKAFVVNRIGDFAFLIGMFLLFQAVGTLDFGELRPFMDAEGSIDTSANEAYMSTFWGGERLAFWAGLFLFIGACGKSAQIPLYVWLPDAMAGPTPVSALIHAATMVTAGVYMIARLSFLYASSTTAMAVVAGVGALTALFAALMAFAQTDFKKVLAYSTVSQLGFMFVGVGVGAYVAGVFHLLTHAFFKAGLFLAAGSVMHAMSGSGDIMKMGGLSKKLKLTHIAFVAYLLAICGILPFAGFFSKDEILGGAFAADAEGWIAGYGKILWVILSLAALGTAFYMSRLYFLVFSGKLRADEETAAHVHESPPSMTGPLLVLALFTLCIGFLGMPHVAGLPNYLGQWLDPSLVTSTLSQPHVSVHGGLCAGGELLNNACVKPHSPEGTIYGLLAVALGIGLLGIFIAWKIYAKGPSEKVANATESGAGKTAYNLSYNKFYVDEIYDRLIVRPFRWIATALYEFADRFVIDLIFVNGLGFITKAFGRFIQWLQNGQVHRYIGFLLAGAAAVFYLTTLNAPGSSPISFSYHQDGDQIVFKADIGAGPQTADGGVLRWDLDGNGKPDLDPDAATDAPDTERYLSDPNPTMAAREVGHQVTLWYTDPVFGDTVSFTRVVTKAATAGGAK